MNRNALGLLLGVAILVGLYMGVSQLGASGGPIVDTAKPLGVTVRCFGMEATIVGTEGADLLIGTEDADVIHGLGGDDLICGGAGDDAIFGGAGADDLRGMGGDDDLRGQAGIDQLHGAGGDDTLGGGTDGDFLGGGAGDDHMRGQDGDDTLSNYLKTVRRQTRRYHSSPQASCNRPRKLDAFLS